MSDRILVGTRKGLFTVRRESSGYRVAGCQFLGDPVNLMLRDPRDGCIYAVLDTGHFGVKMHRSEDDGATFQEIPVPTYPEQPEGEVELTPMQRKPNEWKLRAIWALAAGGADESGLLWCGTMPGGLFVSTDRGDSWEIVPSLWHHELRKEWTGGGADYPVIHSICVHPENAAEVVVGVSVGGVWKTQDHGATWASAAKGMRAAYMPPGKEFVEHMQDPHCIVQCPSAPASYWCQHHNGIFKSTDGAATWTEIAAAGPSTFGFATAVHPEDPKTAWFVPAIKDQARYPVDGKVVVTKTTDGGASFTECREGLPQEHAYDLVFRHALDVDATGERLAFGSTTGSLWVSEDGGGRFAQVSGHLPPVYAVRFA